METVSPAPVPSPPIRLDVAPPYRLVQSRHGWMLVNPNDAYLGQAILQYGECCEIEVAFLLQLLSLRPGLVMEVGTNIGTHTVPIAKALARQNRRLLAFEPQPVIFQNMCANLALNAPGQCHGLAERLRRPGRPRSISRSPTTPPAATSAASR